MQKSTQLQIITYKMFSATNMHVTALHGNVAMERICSGQGTPQFSCRTICPNAVQPNTQSNIRFTLISGQASIDHSLGCP